MNNWSFPCRVQHSAKWKNNFHYSKYAHTNTPRTGTALRRNRKNLNSIIVIWDNAKGEKSISESYLELITH